MGQMTPVATSRVRGTWVSGPLSEVVVRKFEPIRIDEPESMGGSDSAPRPTEYLMIAYAGCTAVIAERVAEEWGFEFTALKTDLRGSLDPRGVEGVEGFDPQFHTVAGRVVVTTDESDELLQRLADEVARRCPLHQTILRSGAEMNVVWVRAGD